MTRINSVLTEVQKVMDRTALCVFVRLEGNSSDFILKIKFLCNNTLSFKIISCVLFCMDVTLQ